MSRQCLHGPLGTNCSGSNRHHSRYGLVWVIDRVLGVQGVKIPTGIFLGLRRRGIDDRVSVQSGLINV